MFVQFGNNFGDHSVPLILIAFFIVSLKGWSELLPNDKLCKLEMAKLYIYFKTISFLNDLRTMIITVHKFLINANAEVVFVPILSLWPYPDPLRSFLAGD